MCLMVAKLAGGGGVPQTNGRNRRSSVKLLLAKPGDIDDAFRRCQHCEQAQQQHLVQAVVDPTLPRYRGPASVLKWSRKTIASVNDPDVSMTAFPVKSEASYRFRLQRPCHHSSTQSP